MVRVRISTVIRMYPGLRGRTIYQWKAAGTIRDAGYGYCILEEITAIMDQIGLKRQELAGATPAKKKKKDTGFIKPKGIYPNGDGRAAGYRVSNTSNDIT